MTSISNYPRILRNKIIDKLLLQIMDPNVDRVLNLRGILILFHRVINELKNLPMTMVNVQQKGLFEDMLAVIQLRGQVLYAGQQFVPNDRPTDPNTAYSLRVVYETLFIDFNIHCHSLITGAPEEFNTNPLMLLRDALYALNERNTYNKLDLHIEGLEPQNGQTGDGQLGAGQEH